MRTTPTEAQTQAAILELLAANHIFAFRLNTAGIKVDKRFFRAHSLGKGAADILAFPRSLVIPAYLYVMNEERGGTRWIAGAPAVWWIEVKAPGKQQSSEQNTFQRAVECEGHNYMLVDSVDQVAEWIKKLCL
jgi:hypothetical protein